MWGCAAVGFFCLLRWALGGVLPVDFWWIYGYRMLTYNPTVLTSEILKILGSVLWSSSTKYTAKATGLGQWKGNNNPAGPSSPGFAQHCLHLRQMGFLAYLWCLLAHKEDAKLMLFCFGFFSPPCKLNAPAEGALAPLHSLSRSLCVHLVCWRSLMLEVAKLPALGFWPPPLPFTMLLLLHLLFSRGSSKFMWP